MSLQRTLVTAIVSMSAFACCCQVHGQHLENFAERHGDNSDFSDLYDPFCELDTCWFEPIDCVCPVERPLNSGWFFGYSRMNVNISRPRDQPGPTFWDSGFPNGILPSIYAGNDPSDYEGDWSWGNRFDFGWVSEDGTGLWLVARKLDNPNRQAEFTNIDSNDDDTNRLDGEPWGPSFVTLNGFNMWAVEVNKIWRLAPTPKGTILEPFIGPRYIRLRDHADRADIFALTPFDVFAPTGGANSVQVERLTFNFQDSTITTDNDLFGGQLGMRSRWRRGRWHITSDLRALAFWNHQKRETVKLNETQQQDAVAIYDANGIITGVNAVGGVLQTTSQENYYDSANTFVYGGEWNLQVAFEITHGFAITASSEITGFADGVGRGAVGTDDSLVLAGYSIGFTFNR